MPRHQLPVLPALLALALALALAPGRPWPPRAAAQETGTFAYDKCEADQECAAGLQCRVDAGTTVCLPTSSSCLCQPTDVTARKCASSTTCLQGERCVAFSGLDHAVCASCKSWPFLPGATPVDRDGASCLSGDTDFRPGYTGDACAAAPPGGPSECVAPRECYFEDAAAPLLFKPCEAAETAAERASCQCRDGDVARCTASTDCGFGERCVRNGTTNAICLGCRAVALEIALAPLDDDDSRCLLPDSKPSPSPGPPSSPRAPYRGGFAWDLCTVDEDRVTVNISATCPPDLFCASGDVSPFSGPSPCSPGEKACFCSFDRVRRCAVSTHCIRGERCVQILDRKSQALLVCAGCQTAADQARAGKWALLDGDDNCIAQDEVFTPSPSPSPLAVAAPATKKPFPRGLTFDDCVDDRDVCVEPRRCATHDRARPCGRDDADCACFPPSTELQTCAASADCAGGERCADAGKLGRVCVACSAANEYVVVDDDEANCWRGVPTPSPSVSPRALADAADAATPDTAVGAAAGPAGPAVCVGAHHLADAGRHELVFARHRVADVLCDAAGSCATAGHMVEFRGATMRMQLYCEGVAVGGCETRRMAVNSPRWRAARRVASHTDGLAFTALAARWGTRVEERLLRFLLRLGA